MTGQEIAVGSVMIGGTSPPVFLPDIDVYFKGDVSLALSLLEDLRAAGAVVLKGALIHDIEICYDGPVNAAYYDPARGLVQERYREVLERHILPLRDAAVIYRRARDLGFTIVLTVYDDAGADFAVDAGAAALKVASSNITHAPLIRYLARKGLPLFIDTGRSTLAEIARAVAWAREAGAAQLIVQHSPEAPPAPLQNHNLRMIPALGEIFGCPSGLSDHHAGNEMMLAAVALGASVVEKGIRADDARGDIDLAHAAPISEVPAILRSIHAVWEALGAPMRSLPSERPRPADRTALVASRDILAGQPIESSAVRFVLAAPPDAIGTEHWDRVNGWPVARDVREGEPVTWNCLRG